MSTLLQRALCRMQAAKTDHRFDCIVQQHISTKRLLRPVNFTGESYLFDVLLWHVSDTFSKVRNNAHTKIVTLYTNEVGNQIRVTNMRL